ncbi:phytoene desaturase [Acaromyces ingoldii]|uniref:Phytoene desaturase n=1 Tax=Acaromyces ingoldii TaxID=215250 RepID=A0A316YI04_9BASI|nr:phytoene desaturase [Acaromyces ingoldii]PWN87345.1 phytoene desaturase [Acaromyces ingoldii]
MANTSSSRKHVIVIGAGVGGAALAARLAHRGYKVTVVEKHSQLGGRCSLLQSDRHRWDVGPSLYLMPELFESFFSSLGLNIDDYVSLERCEPSYKVHFAPPKSARGPVEPLELSTSLPKLGPALARYEGPAGNDDALGSFLAFLKEAGDHYEESVRYVLLKDWNHLLPALMRWDMYPMLLRTRVLRIWSTAWRRACHYFRSDEVRRAMTFSSMYMGMSPFEAPATYTLLQYAEYAKGVFYPIGGFQTVVAAFAKVAVQFGARFIYDATVTRITLAGDEGPEEDEVEKMLVSDTKRPKTSRVKGVELADGTKIEADAVVSNADLIWTYNNLLPPSSYAKRLRGKKQTCSSISFYWGLSEVVEELGMHNIFLAQDYRESFDEIFKDGKVPTEPSFYVNVPSRVDPSAAPRGGDTMVILVPCGPIASSNAPEGYKDKASFEAIKTKVRAQVLAVLQSRIGRDISALIREEHVMDPWDWREKYGLWNGSILGLSHCVSQVLWFRPSNQHETLRNMFFVGASAMPGTGVPVVCAGSGIVADKVDQYFQNNSAPQSYIAAVFSLLSLFISMSLMYLVLL